MILVEAKITTLTPDWLIMESETSGSQKEFTYYKEDAHTILHFQEKTGRYFYKTGDEEEARVGDIVWLLFHDIKEPMLPSITSYTPQNLASDKPKNPFPVKAVMADVQMQIGNSLLYVPPTSIEVVRVATVHSGAGYDGDRGKVLTVRSKGSIKRSTGHSDVRVVMDLIFPSIKDINDPDNGLRALIAQFKRTPFVPVINDLLNSVHNIQALCLHDITVSTVENFPGVLKAQLTCFAFDHSIYMPANPLFINTIDGDLYTWYYKRGLINPIPGTDTEPILKEYKGDSSGISFEVLDEEDLKEVMRARLTANLTAAKTSDTPSANNEMAARDLRLFQHVVGFVEETLRNDDGTLKDVDWPYGGIAMPTDRPGSIVIRVNNDIVQWMYQTAYDAGVKDRPPISSGDIIVAFAFEYGNNVLLGPYGDSAVMKKLLLTLNDVLRVYQLTGGPFWGERGPNSFIILKSDGAWHSSKDSVETIITENLNKIEATVHYAISDKYKNLLPETGGEDVLTKYMIPWEIRDMHKVIVTNVIVSYQNSFARLPVQMMELPAYQYMGSQDAYARISLEVHSDQAMADIRSLFEYCQYIARTYRYHLTTGFMKIKNDLLQLFGVNYVFMDSLAFQTVPGYPGRYMVEFTLMDFDVMQAKREAGEVIMKEGDLPVIRKASGEPENEENILGTPIYIRNQANSIEYYARLNDLLKYINVYPDLDLPTYEEVKNETGIALTSEKGAHWTDPDFYFVNGEGTAGYTLRETLSQALNLPRNTLRITSSDPKVPQRVLYPDQELDTNQLDPELPMPDEQLISAKAAQSEQEESLNIEKYAEARGEDKSENPARWAWTPKAPVDSSMTSTSENKRPEAVALPPRHVLGEDWDNEWSDQLEHDYTGRMIRAFPTAHCFLIDEGRALRWYRMWDNFYGTHAISFIKIIRSRKIAADTAILTMSNVYGAYTDRTTVFDDGKEKYYADWSNWFRFSFGKDELEDRSKMVSEINLQPGARLHIRMGYGNNLSCLPIVFNGTITEVDISSVIDVIAQGDAVEITNILNFAESKVAGILNTGAEPSNLLCKLLLREDKEGIAQAWDFLKDRYKYDPGRVVHFGTPLVKKLTHCGELGMNIYRGNGTGNKDTLFVNDEPNIDLLLYNKSIWDVAQSLAAAVPNYVAAVVPFDFRSTLFYGKPWWDLSYGYKELKPGAAVVKKKPFQQWHIYHSFGHIIDNRIKITADDVYTHAIVRYRRDSATSFSHVELEKTVECHADVDIYSHIQKTMVVESDLYTKHLFPKLSILTGFFTWLNEQTGTRDIALNIGAAAIRDSLKDMYQGELIVIGDPTPKPHDAMYIGDTYNEMLGVCFIKEVIHSYDAYDGFTTSISPDCAAGIPEKDFINTFVTAASYAVSAAAMWFLSSSAAISLRAFIWSAISAGFLRLGAIVPFLFTNAGITSLLAAIGTKFVASATFLGGAPGLVLSAAMFVAAVLSAPVIEHLVHRYFLSKQCVVLNLLMQHNKPISAGINGHKGITIIQGGGDYGGLIQQLIRTAPQWLHIADDDSQELDPEILLGPYAANYQDQSRRVDMYGNKYYVDEEYTYRQTVLENSLVNHLKIEPYILGDLAPIRMTDIEWKLLATLILAELGSDVDHDVTTAAHIVATVINRVRSNHSSSVRDAIFHATEKERFPSVKSGEIFNIEMFTTVSGDNLKRYDWIYQIIRGAIEDPGLFITPGFSANNPPILYYINNRLTPKDDILRSDNFKTMATPGTLDTFQFLYRAKQDQLEMYETSSQQITTSYSTNELIYPDITCTADEKLLLAKLIQAEAWGESYDGKVAVGAVVLNRCKSPGFKNTITDVITQENQFSGLKRALEITDVDEDCINAAEEALMGIDPTDGCTFFANVSLLSDDNWWLKNVDITMTIGNHSFGKPKVK